MLTRYRFFDKYVLRGFIDKIGILSGKFSMRSPRKMEKVHHPDSNLGVTHYVGLFSPRKKLVKAKKLYSQNFSKYAPLKSDRVFSSFVIIRI